MRADRGLCYRPERLESNFESDSESRRESRWWSLGWVEWRVNGGGEWGVNGEQMGGGGAFLYRMGRLDAQLVKERDRSVDGQPRNYSRHVGRWRWR